MSGVEVAPKRLPNTLLKKKGKIALTNYANTFYLLCTFASSLSLSLWLFELANARCTALVVVSRY